MTVSKSIAALKKARVFSRAGPSFDLAHPSISGHYRWRVHGFRHRLIDHGPSSFGLHEELIEHFTNDPHSIFSERAYGKRVYELIDALQLPNSCTPVLYVEVYDIQNEKGSKPVGEKYLNISKTVNRTRHLAPHTTVQRGLLRGASAGSDLKTLMSPVGGFSSWWAPLSSTTSSGLPVGDFQLKVDAGQASGAHTYGWLARGGKSIEVKGNANLWMTSSSSLPTTPTSSPPPLMDLRLDRAGFLLFELQRLEGDVWQSVPQDTEHLINPLSMPLFLDHAETVLVELIKDLASHIKDVPKTATSNPPLTGNEYPMNTCSKNHHHRNQRFNLHAKKSHLLQNDIDTVSSQLSSFLKGRKGLIEWMIPEFGESLSGSKW